MASVFGSVLVSETGRGIPGLVVAAFDVGGTPLRAEGAAVNGALRLATGITDADGGFRVEYVVPTRDGAAAKPVHLQLTVSGPEDASGPRKPLFVAPLVRKNASASEAWQVRISAADLRAAGIALPGEPEEAVVEQPDALRRRLVDQAAREVEVARAEHEALNLKVAKAREDLSTFRAQIRPALAARLSTVRPGASSTTYVAPDASVETVHGRVLDDDLEKVVSRGGVRPKATTRFALTEEQARAVRDKLDADKKISSEDLRALLQRDRPPPGPILARTDPTAAVRRAPSAREQQARDALEGRPQPQPGPPPGGDVPGTHVERIETGDVPRYLARLVETMTTPEEGVLAGLEPRATQGTVTSSLQDLAFRPSPADVPAFYEFHNLQVAFRHVWQEAIDQGVLDIAESAYNEIVLAGGQPDVPGIIVDPVLGLRREAIALDVAARRAAAIGTSARTFRSVTEVANEIVGAVKKPRWLGVRPGLLDTILTATPVDTADPDPLPNLLAELEQRLQEPYAFTTFAANRRERSVNFGLLVTYQQRWLKTAYQAGRLAKTLTLAPKEVQKYTRTVRRQRKRAVREVENHLSVRREELQTTSRAEEEIIQKASTKTNFQLSSETGSGTEVTPGNTTKTSFEREVGQTSEATKRNFRESVVKAAQEFKDEFNVEVNTEDTESVESVESGEISNPNDELAVTFLFYDLHCRYAVSERLQRLTEVVLVAQEMPAPHEINEAWLVSNDWILRRALLDDSFAPALTYLSQRVVGDRAALAEMRTNLAQQRQLIETLKGELTVVRSRYATLRNLLERSLLQGAARKKGKGGGIFGGIPIVSNAIDLAEDAIDTVSDFIHPDMPQVGDSRQDTLKDAMQRTADEERDLLMRIEREVTALNALTESYAKALAENQNQRMQILRLRTHVKQNILYYMQAIWNHEPPDQRYLRLHEVPIPTFRHRRWYRFGAVAPRPGAMTAYAHRLVGLGGVRPTAVYEAEVLTDTERLETKPLSQVADLDRLLGYFGNYMIFPLKESNPLTSFMAEPYVQHGFEELVDPDDPGNWTLDEFVEYVLSLRDRLSADEFAKVRPQLLEQYETLIEEPRRNGEEIVVPTGSLFIEALPATTSLMERFKMIHRAIDVKKVQAEVRHAELENLRLVDRILNGEREDPDVEKKIVVEGPAAPVLPTDG
jgi:hypothetical protein